MPVTINGTTGIAGVDGSASTPSYQGTDNNTGIAFPAADTVTIATGGSERVRVDSSGNLLVGTTSPLTASTASISVANTFGYRNRIINGNMSIAQRATSATVTAGTGVPTASTGYPAVDRFFVYSTGANVTAARVAGTGAVQHRMQITGAASVTAVGVGQRIEQLNSYDLAGSTAILSVDLANSLLTTVTWTASYANTADTFGTIGTPTKTQIATGTFTVTSTVTNYSVSISIPAAATTGIEILFTVGAQTSGTWTIGNVQLEKGSVETAFDYRPYGTELMLCQRYANSTFPSGTAWGTQRGRAGDLEFLSSGTSSRIFVNYVFPVVMRASPTVTYYNPTNNNTNFYNWSQGSDASAAGSFGNTSDRSQMIASASSAPGTDATFGIHASFSAEL